MPHKVYHGKTGVVYNVSKVAVGVIINKKVGGRIIGKRVNLRIEHVKHSNSRSDFLKRVKQNDKMTKEARKTGEVVCTRRIPEQPREAQMVEAVNFGAETVSPIPFEFQL